ncbi:glutamate 5-kinase [Thermodesulfobacteriota bacterium]
MNVITRKNILKDVRRVVIKIGSKILTTTDGLDESAFLRIAREISLLIDRGYEVVIVSSGAIAAGMKKLSLKKKPVTIPDKQAMAAIGQPTLMEYYEKSFSRFGHKIAQILLTRADLANRSRFVNAKNTVFTLLKHKVIPIINENDTVYVEELKLGDNDNLSSMVTTLSEADLLILLTDINGFYKCDPRELPESCAPISIVTKVDSEIESLALDTASVEGTGGMITKLQAVKKTAHHGAATIIANGNKDNILRDIFDGEDVGTLFLQSTNRLKGRKHWIAYTLKPQGSIMIDDGGVQAIADANKSLLPSGIKSVEGKFTAGSSVSLVNLSGEEFARGLVNYNSDELQQIMGLKTKDITKTLGYKYFDEVIHRDDLIVL